MDNILWFCRAIHKRYRQKSIVAIFCTIWYMFYNLMFIISNHFKRYFNFTPFKLKRCIRICTYYWVSVHNSQKPLGIDFDALQKHCLPLCSRSSSYCVCLYWIVSKLKLEWLQPFVLINHFIPIKNYHQLPAYFVLMHLWESWL